MSNTAMQLLLENNDEELVGFELLDRRKKPGF